MIFQNFGYLAQKERIFREENPDSTPKEVVSFLDNIIKDLYQREQINNILRLSDNYDYDGEYSIFGKTITDAEIKLVALYPSQAIIAYNASKDASEAAGIYYHPDEQYGFYLNNGDALRHAYWNALMEKRISKDYYVNLGTDEFPNWTTVHIDFAKEFADAHESATTESVDLEMDLRNNALGRGDGELYSDLSDEQLSFQIMKRISHGYYWKVINHYTIDNVVYGELVSSDWQDLKSEYFEQVMFDSTLVSSDKVRLDKVNWTIQGAYTIPNTLNGKVVVEIGENAFQGQDKITDLVLPNTITEIGDNAFGGCTNLTYISELSNLVKIGNHAFSGCASLKNISIPNSTFDIGVSAFRGCTNLTFNVSMSNSNYVAEGNILYNKSKTEIIAAGIIASTITIPSTVTKIGAYAFEHNSNLNSLNFEADPLIEPYAFANCYNLKTVVFDSFEVPVFSWSVLDGCECTVYVPYIRQEDYISIFTANNINIDSEKVNITFYDSDEVIETKEFYFGAYLSDLPIPIKKGYIFSGWYDNSGKEYSKITVLYNKEDLELNAEWELQCYNAILNTNGGDGVPESIDFTVNDEIELPEPNKDGYNFAGWYRDEAFSGEPLQKIEMGTAENLVLYAKWEAKTIEVFLKCCDKHELVTVYMIFGEMNNLDAYLPDTHEGYIFDGWAYNGISYCTGDGTALQNWLIDDAVTLEAQWIELYYIKIVEDVDGTQKIYWVDKDGNINQDKSKAGIPLGNEFPTMQVLQQAFRESEGRLEHPGYIFKYFTLEYADPDTSPKSLTQYELKDFESDRVLEIYPYFTTEFYNIVLYDWDMNKQYTFFEVYYGSKLNLNYPNIFNGRNGYEFVDWEIIKSPDGVDHDATQFDIFVVGERFTYATMPDISNGIEGDGYYIFLKAVFEAIETTVKFEANNGVNYPTMVIAYDTTKLEAKNLMPVPIKFGHVFQGWFDENYGGVNGQLVIAYDKVEDTTLYAHWVPADYEITYIDRGIYTYDTYTYGEQKDLKELTRTGYAFNGWRSSSDGLVIKSLPAGTSGNITLTADWSPYVYSIYYVSNRTDINVNFPTTQYTYGITTWLENPSNTTDFLGYFTDKALTKSISKIDNATINDITIYVKWNHVWFGSTYRSYSVKVTDKGDYSASDEVPAFLSAEAYGTSYKFAYFRITLLVHEEDDGYQTISLRDSSGNIINDCSETFEHTSGKKDPNTKSYTFEFYVLTSQIINLDYVYICYGAYGTFSDDWICEKMEVDYYLYDE